MVKVWDVETGRQKKTITGFNKQVTSLRYLGLEANFVAVAASAQVRLLKEDGGNIRNLAGARGFTYALAVAPDGDLVAAGGLDGTLRLWRPSNSSPLASFVPPGTP